MTSFIPGTSSQGDMEQQATGLMRTNVAEEESGGADVGPIRACVSDAMQRYFEQLNGDDGADLYRLVLAEVEPPLFSAVLGYCQGNQTRAAQMLGMNRATLRKKLQHYGLL